jgi:predicted permease
MAESWLRDLRHGVRVLAKAPGFSLAVSLSLSLGIAGTSAIFSLLNTLMLRSLAVPRPQELSFVRYGNRGGPSQVSFPMFQQLRQAAPEGSRLAAVSRVARMQARADGDGEPGLSAVQLVSGEFFSTLGLAPVRGRLLSPEDNRVAGGHAVAVLGHAFWRDRFGGAEDVVGRTVTLNGARFTVVGVAPAGFSGLWLESPTAVFISLAMQAVAHYSQNVFSSNANTNQPWFQQERIEWLDVIARTPPEARGAVALSLQRTFERSLDAVAGDASFAKDKRQSLREGPMTLAPFERGFSSLRQRFAGPLYVLMGMAALLLLIACANSANLLLARAASRRHEIALRLSVGATRSRLVQQLFVESILLGAVACVVGLALAPVISRLLVRMTAGVQTGPLPFAVPIDARVVLFTVAVSLATTLIFGLAPAVRTTRIELGTALKVGGRGAQAGGRGRSARLLVVVQVALSLVLVVVAGLFLRSLQSLLAVELGYAREHRLSVAIDARASGYGSGEGGALRRRLTERAASLPGVQSVAASSCGLATSCRDTSGNIAISGYQPGPDERVEINTLWVGPEYFATVGMTLMAGRDFQSGDHTADPNVAIVNEAFARRYLAGRSALGQRFGGGQPRHTIVGVVRDARIQTVREAARPTAFHPKSPDDGVSTLEVRTLGDPRWLAEPLRRALLEVEPRLQIKVTPLSEQLDRNLTQERAVARLTAALGILALGLACFGLYGVMSYAVARRTAELGVRLALGAQPARVLWMVLRESLSLVVLGLGAGLVLVLALSRVLASQLFGVEPTDPPTVIVAAAGMIIVATAAAYRPAWRASRVDPMVALRSE